MTPSRLEDFALERYFARWEFAVAHQLSASDVEPYTLLELLDLADDDARDRWERLSLGYTESAGLPALREAIASQYSTIAADDVLVFAGAEEAIYLMMHAALTPGDEVVVVTPAYQSLHSVARAIGAEVKEVPLSHESGWRLEVERVGRAVSRRTRMIVVNFPHNPTGAHIGPDDQARLVEIAADAKAVLLSDEVYRGLEYGRRDALRPAADLSPTAVSLGVMSKSFALAGLRIGWVATRNRTLLAELARLKDYTTICSSAPSEILALIGLRARDMVLARSREIVARNVAAARSFMEGHAGLVEWVAPRAGSVALPRFTGLDAEEVSESLAQGRRVLLLPGSVFGAGPSHFRLGLGRKDLPAALDALSEHIRR